MSKRILVALFLCILGILLAGMLLVPQGASADPGPDPTPDDETWCPPQMDYGDLPDGPYATLLASNGARHEITCGVKLGAEVDGETNGQPTARADGDDLNGTPDDEDGVVFLTPLMPGTNAKIKVTISDPDGKACLNAFIDFDGNGTLDPVSYTAIDGSGPGGTVSNLMLNSGMRTLTISVPANASGKMPARFRLTDECCEGGSSPYGPASSGEVEDYILASLGNYVWLDTNKNGIQDDGATGQGGVVVNLLDGSGNPVLDAANNPITTVTDGNGYYKFSGLLAGDYKVEFVLPVGYSFTQPNQGSDDALDSDPDVATGRTPAVTLLPGDKNLTLDAGLVPVDEVSDVAIGNLVFCDVNGNGIQDPGDLGQGGVTVRLYSLGADGLPYTGDDVLERTVVTDADGRYVFLALPAGEYYVAVDSSTVPAACGTKSSTGGGGDPDQGDHPAPGGDDGVPGQKAGEVVSGVITVSVNGQTTPDVGNPLGYADASAYMTVDFGFTNDPNAVGLREFRAQSPSVARWLAGWLHGLLGY